MSQPLPEAENRVEMSQNLRASLQRAGGYAAEQSHRFVTIEHILLALNEDQDAVLMLQACAIDQNRLRTDVSEYLGMLQDRIGPDEAAQPVLDTEAGRIVNSAVIAAQKSRRTEVNGAIVLAAIIGDGRTPAANMLRAQGLTFQAAIQALQAAQVPGQQPAAPAKPSPVPQPQPEQQAPPQPQPQSQEAGEPPVAVPPAANQNRVPQINPDAARERREPRINQPRGGATDDVLANARQRVEALREGAPRREPPGERAEPPAGPSEQPSQQSEKSEQLPARDKASEVGKTGEPGKPEPPQPRPLQTADSLTRFERRPPPAAQPGPGENGAQADAEQAAPVPPQELSEQLRKRAEERARAERARKERPQPPSNFSGEALRRPPPPPRQAPEAPPQQQSQPLPHPQANRPPPQQPHPAQTGREPPYQPIGHSEPAIQPRIQREHAPPGYGQPAQQAPGEYAGGGFQHDQLPVPVPEPRRERPVESVVAGQLVENIPRRMRMAVTEIVEVRIARAELEELARGMRGREGAHQHDLIITKAMSVRLRAPEGGFFIETASPETQWIENKLGILSDDYASWRWTVTPQRTGRALLQLIVSARTIGSDGLAAETALPEQIFEVRVSTNYGRLAGRWAGWISAAVAGGLFARFGEQVFTMGQSLLRSTLGG